MKLNKYIVLGLVLSLTIVSFLLYHFLINAPGIAIGVELKGNSSGLTINPEKSLFKLFNIAPGNEDSAILTVGNHRNEKLQCKLTSSLDKGSTLYDALNIRIENEEGKGLYNGKLKNLVGVMLGTIMPNSNKEFKFTIEFPKDCGNEYQGLTTAATFTIIASAAVSNDGNDNKDSNNGNSRNDNSLIPSTGVSILDQSTNVGAATNLLNASDKVNNKDSNNNFFMPLTGVASFVPLYTIGSLAVILGGILLIKKRKP